MVRQSVVAEGVRRWLGAGWLGWGQQAPRQAALAFGRLWVAMAVLSLIVSVALLAYML